MEIVEASDDESEEQGWGYIGEHEVCCNVGEVATKHLVSNW